MVGGWCPVAEMVVGWWLNGCTTVLVCQLQVQEQVAELTTGATGLQFIMYSQRTFLFLYIFLFLTAALK